MHKMLKVFLTVLGTLLLIGLIIGGYAYFKLASIQVEEEKKPVETVPNVLNYETIQGITHVMLVGVDTRGNESHVRSDAMILLTLDTVHGNIKMTSFARDAYVDIPDIGYEKLTHAHAYGGMALLLETVKSNFEVNVEDYIKIDFKSFIVVIDMIKGIEATLEEENLREFNKVSWENYNKFYTEQKKPFESIDAPGTYTLNGYQTLAYVRMRKSDTAFARDDRQREVVEKVFKKITQMPVTLYPKLFEEVLPYISTNIDPVRMLKLGVTALKIGTENIKQLEFPILEYSQGGTLPGKGWVLQWDTEICLQKLKEFLNQ